MQKMSMHTQRQTPTLFSASCQTHALHAPLRCSLSQHKQSWIARSFDSIRLHKRAVTRSKVRRSRLKAQNTSFAPCISQRLAFPGLSKQMLLNTNQSRPRAAQAEASRLGADNRTLRSLGSHCSRQSCGMQKILAYKAQQCCVLLLSSCLMTETCAFNVSRQKL